MSLSPQNSSESVKKMIWRKKNGCHPSFIGHLTPKTLTKQLATTKNTFWGQFPTFSSKMFSSFFRYYDKLIEESSQRKKMAVTHQIMGIWPIKHLQNTEKHNFLQYCNEKDLHTGFWDSQHLSLIESGQTKVFFTTFWMKMEFWRPFRGQIPIFW